MHHQPKITLEEVEDDGTLFLAYSGYPTQVTDDFPKTLGSSLGGWYIRKIQEQAQVGAKTIFYHRPLAPLDPPSILLGIPSPKVQDALSFAGSRHLSVPPS